MQPPQDQALERERAYWNGVRSRGRAAFILRRGVLGFGVPWSVLMALIGTLTPLFGDRPPFIPATIPSFFAFVLYILPFGVGAGVLWAVWVWRRLSRKYRAEPIVNG